MTLTELLADLSGAGVTLWEKDGQLHFRAPRGVLTDDRRAALARHKAQLIDHLSERNGVTGSAELVAAPDERYEPFPLTDVQTAYLVGRLDAYGYGDVGSQVYGELTSPELDPRRLEDAWNRLIERHDMLRAVIHPEGAQQVRPSVDRYRIAVRDLRGDPHEAFDAAVEEVRAELAHRVYRPGEWPMFDLRMTVGRDRAILHVSMDFLVADYLSIQRLLGELSTLYGDPDAQQPPLDVTFRDYVLAERRLRDSGRYERDRRYWWDRIDTLPPAPELPVRTGSPGTFRRLEATLDPEDWAALRRRAGAHGLTASTAVLAAYAEVIGRWSRLPRFTLNLTLLNRQQLHPQVDHLVGDFTTVTLLAVEPDPAAPFHRRAAALAGQLFEDMDHRLCSGVTVLRELARRRGKDAALMPVVFTSTIGLGEAEDDPDALGELTYGISETPQVWIDCQAVQRRDGLALTWDVRDGVFPPGMVEDAFAALERLLRRLATDDRTWQDSDVVPLPEAQRAVRERVNGTTGPLPDGLLHEPVFAQAARTPDRTAVVDARGELTYRELAARAGAVAAALRTAGCRPGDLVAVVMDKGAEQVVGVLGTLLTGAAYLPIDTTQPPARRDRILADAGVRHVLTQSWLRSADWPAGTGILAVDGIEECAEPPAEPSTVDPDGRAYVIYTSGSTGAPKGVVISHRAARNTIDDINRRFSVGPADRVLGLANLGFDLSVYDVFGPLAVGGTLVLPDANRRGDPSHWAELVDRHRVTLWNSVPAQLQMLQHYLAGEPAVRLDSPRVALLSGDWIPVSLPEEIRERIPGVAVISLGGATEAAIWSIHHPIDRIGPDWPSIPYGVPLTNQRFHVLDGALRPRPDWVSGELYIVGAGLAAGYHNDPERTAERFVRHPRTGERLYRTGDLGRYHPDGLIEFLGREDAQVKIRGHRIELAEIEAAMHDAPSVDAAAVIVTGDDPLERRLAGFAQPARRQPDPAWGEHAHRLALAAAEVGDKARAGEDVRRFADFARLLDRASLDAMAATLRAHGLFAGPDAGHDLDEIVAATSTVPRHRRLVRRWLAALTREGYLHERGGRYRAARPIEVATAAATWEAVQREQAHVDHAPELTRYFRQVAEHHGELLRDETDPLRMLFPDGSLDISLAAYRDNLLSRYVNALLIAAVEQIVAGRGGARTRLLEIGAGVGGVSNDLIPALRGKNVDYLYTDVSTFFLNEAAARFPDDPWVRYAQFDMNADYRDQGLAPNSVDVLVCNNSLHYSQHIGQMLARFRELLTPGGWLVFIDQTRDSYPIMSSMEFVEAASDFEDDRRGRAQTFLSREEWRTRLTEAGADVAFALPDPDDPFAPLGQAVIAACVKRDRAAVDPAELTGHLASRLPEYMVPATLQVVDALPLTGNGKVDRAALAGLLPRAGERRSVGDEPTDDLERRLAALWAELLNVPRVGREDDFFTLGGDSLLMSQLAARLRDRVPEAAGYYFDALLRQVLNRPTVAALAEFLRTSAPVEAAEDDRRAPASPLVPMGGAGPGPLRVLVHDGLGTMAPYLPLARRLAQHGPVAGLAVTKVDAYLALHPGVLIERLAADYARLLTEQDRPVHLIGYSLGGLVALEVARHLAERGTEPAALTVIGSQPARVHVEDDLLVWYGFARALGVDPTRLGYPAEDALGAALCRALTMTEGRIPDGALSTLDGEVGGCWRELAARGPDQRIAALAAEVAAGRSTENAEAFVSEHYRVFRQSLAAVDAYRPAPYAGDVTVLRQDEPMRALPWLDEGMAEFWREACLGEVVVRDVAGDHFGCVRPPLVDGLADAVLAAEAPMSEGTR